MESFEHHVTLEQENERIDKLLSDISEESRSKIQQLIKDGLVKVNGKGVKANYKCQAGDLITWDIPDPVPLDVQPENIPLEIIYEDDHVLVVNKPKGMVIHPSFGHTSGTLVNAILYHCKNLSGINGVLRPGIVHRIDKDTSGLLLVAKSDEAHISLAKQLTEKTVKRKYEAIVHGQLPHNMGTIDAPIGRDPKDRQKMAVVDNGKPAVTHFTVIKRYSQFTHVECQLETGRTHQIRVHFHYIGYPLAGDPKYGPRKTLDMDGQALHAKIIGFIHPITKEWMEFEVEPPESFKKVLTDLEKGLY
jgi:23S rRNA pseudouridine1911/1915/1917 synthase